MARHPQRKQTQRQHQHQQQQPLAPIEVQRLKNIARNEAFLKTLNIFKPQPPVPKPRAPRKRKSGVQQPTRTGLREKKSVCYTEGKRALVPTKSRSSSSNKDSSSSSTSSSPAISERLLATGTSKAANIPQVYSKLRWCVMEALCVSPASPMPQFFSTFCY
jgi:hypothetical protein